MKCEGSDRGQWILRKSLSIKVAESHQAGSPAQTAELDVASWLFASREPLEKAFIWCSWKLERTKRQRGGEGTIECGLGGQWEWEERPNGEAPCPGAEPCCSTNLQPPDWLSHGMVWLHSLQGPHTDPSSAPPFQGCQDMYSYVFITPG